MENKVDETRHSETTNVVNVYKSCCCQTQEHVPGDETPHYCCQEETFWQKIKRLFS